jgi:hypothetical protein
LFVVIQLVIFCITCFLIGWLAGLILAKEDVIINEPLNSLIIVQGNSLMASRQIPIIENQELISCLIEHESSGRHDELFGDSGLAYGILQFHEDTFNRYSAKYGLELDYKDAESQILLANYMLSDNIANVINWTVYPKCEQYIEW